MGFALAVFVLSLFLVDFGYCSKLANWPLKLETRSLPWSTRSSTDFTRTNGPSSPPPDESDEEVKEIMKLKCEEHAILVAMCGCVIGLLALLAITLFMICSKLRSLEMMLNLSRQAPHRYSTLAGERDIPGPSDYTPIDPGVRPRCGLPQDSSTGSAHSYMDVLTTDSFGSRGRTVGDSKALVPRMNTRPKFIPRVDEDNGNGVSGDRSDRTERVNSYLTSIP